MSAAMLGLKLETALVAYIEANKSTDLNGLHVAGAHATPTLSPPFLAIWCSDARRHPDFDTMSGIGWPSRVRMEFLIRVSKHTDFAATCGVWGQKLVEILAHNSGAGEFSRLMAALNPGGAHHPAEGLYVQAVCFADDALSIEGDCRIYSLSVEFDCQNGDPSV